MQFEAVAAAFLLACVVCFFSIVLRNILRVRGLMSRVKAYAEVERPSDFVVGVAALGTFAYFVEVFSYVFIVFTGLNSVLSDLFSHFQFAPIFFLQLPGLVLTAVGYFIFIWSVVARGRYAVSWEMPENQRLVTWGPYRYVRHPSYLGYFFMFFGLFFLWLSLFTLLPLIAVPAYYRITFDEEKLLARRFGDEYAEYQKKTGRFIPRVHAISHT